MSAPQAILSIRDLHVAYGGIQAVKGVEMDVYPGELLTVIGANGALTGFGGGLPIKQFLLRLEGALA